MVLSPRSVRFCVKIQAFTERLLSDSAFDCARISPDLTSFGRAENRGPVPSRDFQTEYSSPEMVNSLPFF